VAAFVSLAYKYHICTSPARNPTISYETKPRHGTTLGALTSILRRTGRAFHPLVFARPGYRHRHEVGDVEANPRHRASHRSRELDTISNGLQQSTSRTNSQATATTTLRRGTRLLREC
jgi:hypothetical protein